MSNHTLYILKIGGSVATEKSAARPVVRRALLVRSFKAIRAGLPRGAQLIIIHGAGSFAHPLAKKYGLRTGTGTSNNKKRGAALTRLSTQKLNTEVLECALEAGLLATSVHTGTLFTQKNNSGLNANMDVVTRALNGGYMPILYGEMVFDSVLGMTVCGGDRIVAHLAKKLPVTSIFFASDVAGICTEDPHLNKKAKLVREVSLARDMKTFALSESHSTDVTGGLKGKIETCANVFTASPSLKEMHIFSGLVPGNYSKVLKGRSFPHTIIKK